jgi:CHRD domain
VLKLISSALLVLPLAAATQGLAAEAAHHHEFQLRLSGAREDPTVITFGRGTAVLRIQGNTVAYNVQYRDLGSDIEQAHIHIGADDTTGGIAAFLCNDLTLPVPPPPGTASCPPAPGQLVGVIDAAEVIGPAAQGVAPGDIQALIRAIRTGLAYVNIHTVISPAGEIRGDVNRQD